MIDGQRVHREARFKLREFVEIIDDDLRNPVPLQLDHDARILIGLIANGGNIRNDFFIHQFGDALNQNGPVYVIGNFRNDDLLAATLELLNPDLPANFEASLPGVKIFLDRLDPADHATGRKIRSFNELHQLRNGDVRVVDLRDNTVDHFAQIVGRHVRGHPDGDSSAAINDQIWKC